MAKLQEITKLSIFHSIVKILIVSLSFFLGVHFEAIGLSGAQIGLIFATGTLTSIISVLPSGFSSDRFNSKKLITLALILLGIQYFGFSAAKQFPLIMVLFFLGGIGTTLYTAASDSLFYKTTNNQDVPQKISLFLGLNYLTMGAGMVLAGFLNENSISFENIFFGVAIGFILMALISSFVLPGNRTTELEFIDYKADLFQPKVLLFLLIMFLYAIHFGAESTTYGLFLKKTLGLSSLEMGLYMGIAVMTMAASIWVISKSIKKIKVKYILLIGLFMSGTGHIFMTVEDPILSFAIRVYHEFGDAAAFFFLYYGITKLFDLKRVGGNAGIFSLVQTLGSAIGALIFGPMGAAYGYSLPLIVSGVTTLLAFFIALQFLHHFDHN